MATLSQVAAGTSPSDRKEKRLGMMVRSDQGKAANEAPAPAFSVCAAGHCPFSSERIKEKTEDVDLSTNLTNPTASTGLALAADTGDSTRRDCPCGGFRGH